MWRNTPDTYCRVSRLLHWLIAAGVLGMWMVGQGPDPWGGCRMGFPGTTRLKLADYGIDHDLGPASREVDLFLSIEGIRR